ncbi:MAG: restriction endonuclease subunit S [Eubacterium sp.]
MNYLTEILAFYEYLGRHSMSVLLQSYWHLLLYFNNKSAVQNVSGDWFWPVEFTVPNRMVMRYLGLKNRFQVAHARTHLLAHGLVHYKAHGGNQAGKYTLIPFDKGILKQGIPLKSKDECTQVWTQIPTETAHKSAPFINRSLNNKQTYPSLMNQGSTEFIVPPELSEDEKKQLVLEIDDPILRFWEERKRRDTKERED